MSKYIKLDTAIEHTNQLYHGYEVEEWLESLPTIDIVRCKECKHCQYEVIEETMPIYIYCDLWKGETEWDSYCSYGERLEQ